MGPAVRLLPDGRRLHLNHGPIDVILELWGAPAAVAEGRARATQALEGLLEALVAELPALRSADPGPLTHPVAHAMAAAVAPYRPAFVTPMAAVAGAVADHLLAAAVAGGAIAKGYANNGGDIALHLAPGESLTAAIAARPGLPDRVTVRAADPVRGIATSGRGGRSQSLGIADAVTVLAATAARADAAATMIANAVDLPGHPAVTRRPACEVKADSDLGARPVTVAVGPLSPADRARALARGRAFADGLVACHRIEGAALFLQGAAEVAGRCPLSLPATNQGEAGHVAFRDPQDHHACRGDPP
ncbi:UPF0280 family protein [Frigidibacter sp. MR17.14]|uniref:UPF0280 family protein n=1 Tax=Frigidibacter sp. MR17.14 TaxID=3126509 RepID=UPI003012BDD7